MSARSNRTLRLSAKAFAVDVNVTSDNVAVVAVVVVVVVVVAVVARRYSLRQLGARRAT